MISDEERKRQQQLKKEEEKARERISGPVKHLMPMELPTIGRKFDMTDPKTRLICEKPATGYSYWRTEEGDYIGWVLYNSGGPGPKIINTTDAHEMMNRRERAYTWYITEDESKELQEDDDRIERKRRLGL
ncbi:MAG: hypothetical protein ACLPI9_04620 [Halobacteriota archaeon]|jgi:hypothetical protein